MSKKDDCHVSGIPGVVLMLQAMLDDLSRLECEINPLAWLVIADLDRGTTELQPLAANIRLEHLDMGISTRMCLGQLQTTVVCWLTGETCVLDRNEVAWMAQGRFAFRVLPLDAKPDDHARRDFYEAAELRRHARIVDYM